MIWKKVGVSVVGSSHERSGKPCQDSNDIRTGEHDCLIGIVADGLGSAERAEIGSQLAVKTAVAVLEEGLKTPPATSAEGWHQLLTQAFVQVRGALEVEAQTIGCPLRELGTTLIVFIAFPGGIAIGQIGDGAVVVQAEDDTLTTISSPQRGEFANETAPLTMDNALEQVRYSFQLGQVKNIAAFSDGLQNLALVSTNYTPHAPFFQPLFNYLAANEDVALVEERLRNFLASEKVCSRTDDDKTLLLAVSMSE